MNVKGDLCISRHIFLAIALYLTQQNWKCLHIRDWQYASQGFGVVCLL